MCATIYTIRYDGRRTPLCMTYHTPAISIHNVGATSSTQHMFVTMILITYLVFVFLQRMFVTCWQRHNVSSRMHLNAENPLGGNWLYSRLGALGVAHASHDEAHGLVLCMVWPIWCHVSCQKIPNTYLLTGTHPYDVSSNIRSSKASLIHAHGLWDQDHRNPNPGYGGFSRTLN